MSTVEPAPAIMPIPHSRIQHGQEAPRLVRNFLSLVEACPFSYAIGEDASIRQSLDRLGLDKVIAHRVNYRSNVMTIMVVPGGIWHEQSLMDRIRAIKHKQSVGNRRVRIIPESAIHRQPRLSNSRMISNAVDVWVPPEDRMAILLHLIENGYSTVIDCAREVKAAPPMAAIFQMVAEGTLLLDLDQRILPHSRVDLIGTDD